MVAERLVAHAVALGVCGPLCGPRGGLLDRWDVWRCRWLWRACATSGRVFGGVALEAERFEVAPVESQIGPC
jgi:hypothetical protein